MATKNDYFLDITRDVCPITFVKTKLMIERMTTGQRLEVILKGAEPLENVPRSVEEMGESIVVCEPIDDEKEDKTYRLIIEKA